MVPATFQVIIIGLMILVPTCLIYKKAGFSPLWGFLVFLPGIGLLLIFLHLALFTWPNAVEKTGE